MAEITICEYLTETESKDLLRRLKNVSIVCRRDVMNASLKRIGLLYAVSVDERDVDRALIIVNHLKAALAKRRLEEQGTCPKCRSIPPVTRVRAKLTWFQRMYSMGTKAMECSKCGKQWYA